MTKTIDSSSNDNTIFHLVREAEQWIEQKLGMRELDFDQSDLLLEQLIDSILQTKVVGTELLLGKLFD